MKNLIVLIFLLTVYSNTIYSQVNTQDSLALVDLYYSTNGPSWTNQNNWLTGPIKTWTGVHFYYPDSTRVSAITLGGNNISGQIPNSIGDLTELLNFEITGSNLGGNFPHTIGRLKKCTRLFFHNNQMTGSLTDSLGGMVNLQKLFILRNNFTGSIPSSLTTLPYFYELDFEYNNIEDLPDFSQAPQSSYFYMKANNNNLTFEDIEPNMPYFAQCIPTCIPNYAPQFDSVNMSIDTTIEEHTTLAIHCSIGGLFNQYQWTKDGVDIPFATDSVLTFNSITLGDSGVYSCRITNHLVIGLTYHRRPVKVHVDKVTNTMHINKGEWISIYPNPSNNNINIEVNLNNKAETSISIYDVYGNCVQVINNSNIAESIFTVDVSNFSSGVYFVRLINDDNFITKNFTVIK